MSLRVGAMAAAAAALASCTIDVGLDGKRCPCAEGYTCDTLRDVCVRRTCDPTVTVSDFSPSWATAHDIRWTWTPNGPEDRFLRYELWTAESEEDLASRTGTAKKFGPDENPELGGFRIRIASDLVASTVTRGLAAGTAHYAQLSAVDVADCAFSSDVVARATVPEPQNAITLFDDALLPGATTYPSALEVSTEGGDAHLRYETQLDVGLNSCFDGFTDLEDVQALCGQPLRVFGFSMDVSPDPQNPTLARLTPGTFVDAYVQMHVTIEAVSPSYFSTVWLTTGTCGDEGEVYRFEGLVLPNERPGGIDVEVPLSVLSGDDGAPFTYSTTDTQSGGSPLCGFALAGSWHKLGIVRIDDVRLRF